MFLIDKNTFTNLFVSFCPTLCYNIYCVGRTLFWRNSVPATCEILFSNIEAAYCSKIWLLAGHTCSFLPTCSRLLHHTGGQATLVTWFTHTSHVYEVKMSPSEAKNIPVSCIHTEHGEVIGYHNTRVHQLYYIYRIM